MDYNAKARDLLFQFENELSFAHTLDARNSVRDKHRECIATALKEAVEEEQAILIGQLHYYDMEDAAKALAADIKARALSGHPSPAKPSKSTG